MPVVAPPPRTREGVEARARQATRDLREEAQVPDADRTYRSEQHRYIAWVTQKRNQQVIPNGPRFLARENVDLYFAEDVAHCMIKPESVRRVVSALQWMADKQEFLGEEQRFVIDDSQRVKDALELQKVLYEEHLEALVEDPHKKLPTDRLEKEQSVRVISTVLSENRQNWQDFCIAWTGCEAMMTQNDSMHKFWLCDLKVLRTHGPHTEGPFD